MYGLSQRTLNEIRNAMDVLEHPDEYPSHQECLSIEELRRVTNTRLSYVDDWSLSRRAVVHLLGCPQCVQLHRDVRAMRIRDHE
jgi:hypothetical protein